MTSSPLTSQPTKLRQMILQLIQHFGVIDPLAGDVGGDGEGGGDHPGLGRRARLGAGR